MYCMLIDKLRMLFGFSPKILKLMRELHPLLLFKQLERYFLLPDQNL